MAAEDTKTVLEKYTSLLNKVVAEHQKRASAALKPVPTDELEKAASVLVETGFVPAEQKAAAAAMLADPRKAISALQSLAQKAASLVGSNRDPRLASGTPLGGDVSAKSEGTEKSAADALWQERLERFRNSKTR